MPHLDEIRLEPPDMDALRGQYDALLSAFESAQDDAAREAAVRDWDRLRREFQTWVTQTTVRFSLDTRDEDRKAAQSLCDTLEPEVTRLDTRFKQAIVESPHRAALERQWGTQAFARWACDMASFAPEVQEMLVEEKQLISRYSQIMGGFQVEFQGKPHNLSQMLAYRERADPELRRAAADALWGGLAKVSDDIDALFDQLVGLRHRIATTLGYTSFVELGYKRMQRIDYTEADVETFRAEVLRCIVPLLERVRSVQAERLGLEPPLAWWDRSVFSRAGNPEPGGDHTWMMDAAHRFFEDFDSRFAEFYSMMRELGMLDLDARDGKAPGGYCNIFYRYGLPFIFANFQKTTADISVFSHEMGHAFQFWTSREQPLMDSLFGTIETAEIPSMSLEYLTLPHLHHFLGERAQEFEWIHVAHALGSLTSTLVGDAWQHWVYRNPEATPEERRAQWAELEARYQPDVHWGELESQARGRLWNVIGHFFFAPFYYIDYALAGTIAMQFWVLDVEDHDEAMRRYTTLCELGGSLAFQDTLAKLGMRSPFEPGSLDAIAEVASRKLFGAQN